jgi:hypothetical protein
VKRILILLTVAALMAAMLVASAMPAFAVAGDTASCRGQGISDLATSETGAVGEGTTEQTNQNPGIRYGKTFVSGLAQQNSPCPF